jgi:DNA-binding NarL/FixJ family response regulator
MAELKTVLIVDKSPIFRKALKDFIRLEMPDAAIAEAQTAEQALDLARETSPNFVVADIDIPGNSGLDLLAELDRMKPGTPLVVLTSYDSAEYEHASRQRGAEFFLSKECSSGLELRRVIHEAAEKSLRGLRDVSAENT